VALRGHFPKKQTWYIPLFEDCVCVQIKYKQFGRRCQIFRAAKLACASLFLCNRRRRPKNAVHKEGETSKDPLKADIGRGVGNTDGSGGWAERFDKLTAPSKVEGVGHFNFDIVDAGKGLFDFVGPFDEDD